MIELKRRANAWWILAFVAVLVGAICTRAFVQFRTAVPPAMDPAYYPVQAWWLFNEGRLLYQDAPLIFVIDGLVAKAMTLAGMQSDRAYLVASQLVDCVTEPWVAAFVFLFGFAWCGGSRRGVPVAMAGAVLAVLSAPVIRMVSDFEKNSLGLVWAAMAWWSLWRALHAIESRKPRPRAARWFIAAFAALSLAALTHGGSFGCAAFGAAAILAAWCLSGGASRRTLLIGAVSAAIVCAAALGILSAVSPSRAQALLQAPQKMFGSDDGRFHGGGRGPEARGDRGPLDAGPDRASPKEGDPSRMDPQDGGPPPMGRPSGEPPRMGSPGMDPRGGGPPRGGPPNMGPPGGRGSHGTFIGLGVGLCAIAVVAARWRRESAADRAAILGLGALCMLLVCPFLNPEYAQRLNLMAAVPVGIVFTYLGARLAVGPGDSSRAADVDRNRTPRPPAALWPPGAPLLRAGAAWAVAAAVSFGALHSISGNSTPGPVITEDELRALFAMRSRIPSNALVVAEHGLEWWAGYALHAAVRMDRAPDDAATKYSCVLYLRRRAADPRRPGPPGGTLSIPENARRVYESEFFEMLQAPVGP